MTRVPDDPTVNVSSNEFRYSAGQNWRRPAAAAAAELGVVSASVSVEPEHGSLGFSPPWLRSSPKGNGGETATRQRQPLTPLTAAARLLLQAGLSTVDVLATSSSFEINYCPWTRSPH
ncbi:hypothetical protein FB45DRAFT_1009997 [Roridomyces roridus]|uniref:Uncharacterized protein n=1 Tax=Roridomyces roridus TaxID=1738132 RepID=A0AAD7F981_9AGAR|nr:hypothetical protein FB45DRAFT_1009997 [Roridomyces roridus]